MYSSCLITTDENNGLLAVYHKDLSFEKKKVVGTCKQKHPTCAVFSTDGNHLFVGSKDNDVNCYKFPSFEYEGLVARSDHSITSLSINRNNILVVGSMSDNGIKVVDVNDIEKSKTMCTISTPGGIISAKINDNNVLAALGRERDLRIWKIDVDETELYHNKQHFDKALMTFWNNQQGANDTLCPIDLSWHICGDLLVTPNVTIVESKDEKEWKKNCITKGETGGSNNYIASLSPNSVHVALVDIDKNIHLFELENLMSAKKPKPYKTIQVKSVVTSVEWSNHSNQLFICDIKGKIHTINDFVNEKKQKTTYKTMDCERYLQSLQAIDTDDVLSLMEDSVSEKPSKQQKKKEVQELSDDDVDELMRDHEAPLVEEEEIEPLEVVHTTTNSKPQSSFSKKTDVEFDMPSLYHNISPAKHAPVQPGSSPFEKSGSEHKRYLAVTQQIGIITASTNMTPESCPYYSIHIKFNIPGHSEEKYNDNTKPHVAALNENGIVFGSNPNSLVQNGVIQYRKLRVTHQDKGWRVNLSSDEKVVAVALGSSFVAAGINKGSKASETRCSFVRVYSREQLEMGNIAVGGNLVSLCASDNNLIIIYQQGSVLSMDWYDISTHSCLKSNRVVPCQDLVWAGFGSETKDLFYVLDNQQILYLFNPDTDSFSVHCDLRKNDTSSHFITIIKDTDVFSILCNNQKSTPAILNDMTSFKLQTTNIAESYIGSSIELERGHDKSLKMAYNQYVTKRVIFNQAVRKNTASKDDIVSIDRLLIGLITRCIELKESNVALNFAKLLSLKGSLNIVVNFAESQRDNKLASSLQGINLTVQNVSNPNFPLQTSQNSQPSSGSASSVNLDNYMTKQQVTELVKQLLKTQQKEPASSIAPLNILSLDDESVTSSPTKSITSSSPSNSERGKGDKFEGEAEFEFDDNSKNIPAMFSPKRPKRKSIDAVKRKISNGASSKPVLGNPFEKLNEKGSQKPKEKETSQPSTSSNILTRISELGGEKENEEKKRKRTEKQDKQDKQEETEPTTKKKKQTTTQQPSVLEFVKKSVAIPKISSLELSAATKQAMQSRQMSQDEEEDDLDVSGILN